MYVFILTVAEVSIITITTDRYVNNVINIRPIMKHNNALLDSGRILTNCWYPV